MKGERPDRCETKGGEMISLRTHRTSICRFLADQPEAPLSPSSLLPLSLIRTQYNLKTHSLSKSGEVSITRDFCFHLHFAGVVDRRTRLSLSLFPIFYQVYSQQRNEHLSACRVARVYLKYEASSHCQNDVLLSIIHKERSDVHLNSKIFRNGSLLIN